MTRKAPAAAPVPFEEALAELERLVASMDAQSLSLEQSVAAYERGAELIKVCQQHLEQAREKLQILDGGLAGELRPLDLES